MSTTEALQLAVLFHETYERLAPAFGYETRPDTKAFDPNSANGKLMQAVCEELRAALAAAAPSPADPWQPIETAPQDGYMLVHEDEAIRALFRYKGEWQKIGYPAIIVQPWGDAAVGVDAKRLLPPNCTLEIRDGCCENPTHWMPLPAAPGAQPARQPERMVTFDDRPMLRSLAAAEHRIARLESELAQARAAVPEGCVLVPMKITEAMHQAAVRTVISCTGNDDMPPRVWRAMLAAAPNPPARPAAAQEPVKHVGDSGFEGWYEAHCTSMAANPKQAARDAYAAGMRDDFGGPQENAEGIAKHFDPVTVARWYLHMQHWRKHYERELVFCESRITHQRAEIVRLQNAATTASIMAGPVVAPEAVTPDEPDMPAICAALGFDPTNHHNAEKCPYCRPSLPTVSDTTVRIVDDIDAGMRPPARNAELSDADLGKLIHRWRRMTMTTADFVAAILATASSADARDAALSLTVDEVQKIADNHRGMTGGVSSTRVYEFACDVLAAAQAPRGST